MNLLREAIFSFSFRARLLVAIGALLILASGIFGLISSYLYQADKIKYIYDLHHYQTVAAVNRLQGTLSNDAGARRARPGELTRRKPESMGIPRLPTERETFVARLGKRDVLIGRAEDGEYWLVDLSKRKPLLPEAFGVAYAVTSFGTLLDTTRPDVVRASNLEARAAVQEFLKSGLSQGLKTVRDDTQALITGFREVPGTNVTVFVETSISDALRPVRVFWTYFAITGLVIAAAGIGVGASLVRSLLKPIDEILRITRGVANGEYEVTYEHGWDDELQVVFGNLDFMANTLKRREEGLRKLKTSLERLLEGTKDMASATEACEAAARACRVVVRNIDIEADCGCTLYLLQTRKANEGTQAAGDVWRSAQILKNGLVVKKPVLALVAPSDAPRREHLFETMGAQAFSTDARDVWVPVFQGKKQIGALHYTSYRGLLLSADDASFLNTLAQSLAITLENISYVAEVQEKAKLDAELGAAKAIQEQLLPQTLAYPGVRLMHHYTPAAHTGGDWFGHFHDVEAGRIYFYIGDVTGHGVASALITGVACGAVYAAELSFNALRAHAAGAASGAQGSTHDFGVEERLLMLARSVNAVVHQSGKQKLLMTMFFLSLDLRTGKVHYLNAGHNPPYWIQRGKKQAKALAGAGSRLGFTLDPKFTIKSVTMEPGDALFLFTDGLVENAGPSGEILKERRLKDILAAEASLEGAHEAVFAEARGHWKGNPPDDDVTTLFLEWTGASNARADIGEGEGERGGAPGDGHAA